MIRTINQLPALLLLAAVPLLMISHNFLGENQTVLNLGITKINSTVFGWPRLKELIWHSNLLFIVSSSSIALLLYLSQSLNWKWVLLLLQIAFIGIFYLLKTWIYSDEIVDNEFLWVTFYTLLILTVVMLVRYWKKPSWRERHELLTREHSKLADNHQHLKAKVHKLKREDFPRIFESYITVSMAAKLMEDHHVISAWKEFFITQLNQGDNEMIQVLQDLELELEH